jgi:hypothetical protein
MRPGWLVVVAVFFTWYCSAPLREAAAEAASARRALASMLTTAAPVELGTETVTVRIPIGDAARGQIEAAMVPTNKTTLALDVEGITFDAIPDVHYQLYLDLPNNETPDYKSVYFIGNLTFFVTQQHRGAAEPAYTASFDITRTFRDLKSRNLLNETETTVTFVMRWLEDRNGQQLPVAPGVRARFTNIKIAAITLAR